jgi:tetratricopeptide (TPR) repeat protein
VNENDEILFTGLFDWNPGAKKNYPIVRHGKLASLFEERIPLDRSNPSKTVEVHLADVMSFGGNSGSPVFLRLGGLREATNALTPYSYYLLGVMKGFFPEGLNFSIEVAEMKGSVAQNSGIAAIIPADKILNLLDSPRGRAYRELVFANSEVTKGKFAEAEKSYIKAIEILQTSAPRHSDFLAALDEYAHFLRTRNRSSEALDIEKKANQIRNIVQTDRMHPES